MLQINSNTIGDLLSCQEEKNTYEMNVIAEIDANDPDNLSD